MPFAKSERLPVPPFTAREVERFWALVARSPRSRDCWNWTGATNGAKGYGRFGLRGWHVYPHRVSFAIAHGRWPEPCALHRCDNPKCVRPSHLFEGTIRDNNVDMVSKNRHHNWNRAKTECKRGHAFTPENTRLVKGGRACKTCELWHTRRYRQIAKEARVR